MKKVGENVAEKKNKDRPEKEPLQSGGKAPRKLPQKMVEKQFKKGSAQARESGRKGGIKSGESKRNKRDARESIRYMLELSAKKGWESNLIEMGVETSELTNMNALSGRLFSMAMSGDIEAYRELMRMGGFDPEEKRKERESIAADRRREVELNAKVEALGNGPNGSSAAISMDDEDGNNDVVIYMPKVENVEDCELPPEDGSGK